MKKIGLLFSVEDLDGNLKTTKYVNINININKNGLANKNDIKSYLKDFCENHFFAREDRKKYEVSVYYSVIYDIHNIHIPHSDENNHSDDGFDFFDFLGHFGLIEVYYNPKIKGQ
ncbi:hypothetical protein [Gluconobacter cerinus]|uniref:hypothetical protein n=1 Tax=Gluconobacter cerinus TaxID=38307 RepID=UPI001B8DA66D|nr:hypothetical protein [Gluconobacter cerinus]MBS1035558.1 hypothetical protein [Gluconobacter cerinus]